MGTARSTHGPQQGVVDMRSRFSETPKDGANVICWRYEGHAVIAKYSSKDDSFQNVFGLGIVTVVPKSKFTYWGYLYEFKIQNAPPRKTQKGVDSGNGVRPGGYS